MKEKNILGTMPIPRLFIKLTAPAVIGQIINMLYNIVDRIFIGKIPDVGPMAITGMGICMPLIILITAFSSLIGMGGAPLASIAMGKDDLKKAEQILGNSFLALLGLGIFLTAFFYGFKEEILFFFGASENTIYYAMEYAEIYILGSIFVLMTMGLNVFISAQGFSLYSMITVSIGAVINIILDPLLIFYFNLGIKGAAIATVIAQGISMIWVLKFLIGHRTQIRLFGERLRINPTILSRILLLGVSPFIMQSTESLLNITLNTSLLKFGGDLYVGSMSIMATISQFLVLPLSGLVQGAQPIISYNFGAKKPKRMKSGFKILLATGVLYTLIFYCIILWRPSLFTELFTTDKNLLQATNWSISIYMAGYIMLPFQIICQQSFLAMGQAKISLFLALLRKIILLIPLIYILPFFMNQKVFAVFLAEPIADIIAALTTTLLFYRYFREKIRELEGDIHVSN